MGIQYFLQYWSHVSYKAYMFSMVKISALKCMNFPKNATQTPDNNETLTIARHSFATLHTPPVPIGEECVVSFSVVHCQMFDCVYFH